jgi:hypothetical protein
MGEPGGANDRNLPAVVLKLGSTGPTSGDSLIAVYGADNVTFARELRERGLADEVIFSPETRVLVAGGRKIPTNRFPPSRGT